MKKNILLSILSGLFLSLSFSSLNLELFAWCGLILLLIALEHLSLRWAFFMAFLCGIVFWSLTVYWLIHVTLIGQIILILYLALYFGLFGTIVYFSRFITVNLCLFFLPASWVLLEYVRSYLFSGFPWVLIGLSQYRNLPVIQIADITGAWGVSFLVVLVNNLLYLRLRRRLKGKIILICLFILLLSLGYGAFRLSKSARPAEQVKIKVSVIQGNIPQDLKWEKQAVNFIQGRYRDLTVAAAKNDKPDLIIWPESSVPGLLGRDDEEFRQVFSLAESAGTALLVGAVSSSGQNYFNSALLISRSGSLDAVYHKLHLVPFGEFIPLRNIFPFLETIAPIGEITPGREYTLFKQPVEFGVLICFEDLFPELSREFVNRGARLLVNITNDAWYKKSSAAYQHFAASVFRAVENRRPLARAANTGISGVIDPTGRVLGSVKNSSGEEIFVQGYLTQEISLPQPARTIYNRFGDFFIALCLALDACVIIFTLKKKKC